MVQIKIFAAGQASFKYSVRPLKEYLKDVFYYIQIKLKKEHIMQWAYLFAAGCFEVAWTIGLKLSNGFSHLSINILTILDMVTSFYFLSLSLKSIPLGTAYAVWTGIGTAGTVILGIIIFKEPLSVMKIACIVLIISGISGLKLLSE